MSSFSATERLRKRAVELLINFEALLERDDLREQVQSLIPVFLTLRDLGSSLIPGTEASSARSRILHYLRRYPDTVIRGDELMVVAGINEWPRRVRELRVEHGWPVISGVTAKQMADAGELSIADVDSMGPEDYVLLSGEQDRDAAHRWHVANEVRRMPVATRERLLEFLRRNAGRPVTGEELRYVAKEESNWPRRVRELRTEEGWPVYTRQSGRPDLPGGTYLLESDRQSAPHDRHIPDDVRVEVLERDRYACRRCGWSVAERRAGDPRQLLELHHIEHHAHGGANTAENLVTLCNVHHDQLHRLDRDWSLPQLLEWLDDGRGRSR